MSERNRQTTTIDEVAQECAAIRTRMAARSVTRAYDEALRPLGLRVTQFTLMVAIERGASESISALADKLAMERTTLTRNLRLLEKQGLIELGPEGYRRARSMQLTGEGRSLLAKALPVWRETQDALVQRLGAERWDTARALLGEIIQAA